MWPFKSKSAAKCVSCSRRLTLLEWSELRHPPDPKDAPYKCYACGQVFCFDCLDKGQGAPVGTHGHRVVLSCSHCGASEIKYATIEPLPEDPEKTVARRANELKAGHGRLVEVRCVAQEYIELEYKDGTVIDGRLGGDKNLLTCGYGGQGPTQFHIFLTASGFQISRDEVYDKKPPYTLRNNN